SGFSAAQVAGGTYGNGPLANTNVYLDNCSISDPQGTTATVYSVSTNGATPSQTGWGLWNCTFTNPQSSLNGHSIFYAGGGGGPTQWWFVVGGTITGGSNPASANVLLHHIYPNAQLNSLYRWINFGAGGSGSGQRNFCINLNYDNGNSGGDQ